jgi:hypothetical protein
LSQKSDKKDEAVGDLVIYNLCVKYNFAYYICVPFVCSLSDSGGGGNSTEEDDKKRRKKRRDEVIKS